MIEHRSGFKMKHVDALSRYPVMTITADVSRKIQKAQELDNEVKSIKEVFKEKPYDDYFPKDDIVYKMVNNQEPLIIPNQMQNKIIRTAHEQRHFSVRKLKI